MPGLIDLHSDAIEKEAEPRSRVLFPLDFAVAQVDRRNAAAGITTPYHALSFANSEWGVRNQTAAEVVRALRAHRRHSLVDNRVHCRYEVTDPTAVDVAGVDGRGRGGPAVVMDHSPGQGQFKTLESYLQYMMGNHAMSRAGRRGGARAKTRALDGSVARVEALAHAHALGIPTASHDDDSIQRIATMRNLGVAMSEFPITLDTARARCLAGCPPSWARPMCCAARARAARCEPSTRSAPAWPAACVRTISRPR